MTMNLSSKLTDYKKDQSFGTGLFAAGLTKSDGRIIMVAFYI